MYEYSWLLAAYLKSVSRECPKTAASTTAKQAAPKNRDFFLCFIGEDLETLSVGTEIVGSRAAAPFDEEHMWKVFLRMESDQVYILVEGSPA